MATQTPTHSKFDDSMKQATYKANLTATKDVCSYEDSRIKCLQGIIYWITYLKMRGKPVVPDEFEHQESDLAMDMDCIYNYELEERKANENFEFFEVNKWIGWEDKMIY